MKQARCNFRFKCFAVFVFFFFIYLSNTGYSQNQDSLSSDTVIQEDVNTFKAASVTEKDDSPIVENKIKQSPFYAKWWFSLIIVLLITPFIYKMIMNKLRQRHENEIASLKAEINNINQTIKAKEEESLKAETTESESSAKEKELRYQSEGIATFSEILSKNKNNTKILGQKIISELVQYTNANSGAIYLLKEEESDDPNLEFLAGFAPTEKQVKSIIKPGEGYIGTCFKEGKTMELTNITESFLKISSGLGESTPVYEAFVPLLHDEIKLGVIEIASFHKLDKNAVTLIEKLSDNLASSLAINRMNDKMQVMLEQSREQAKYLQEQEEKLRQNLEEMQATQEELQRKAEENNIIQESLAKETALLNALLENIPEHIYFKDKESKFIKNSKSLSKLFGFEDMDAIMGKSDFDFFDEEHAMPAYNGEQEIINTGVPIIDLIEKEVKKDGSVRYVSTTKMPLKDLNGNIIGTFGISKDVTAQQQMEMDVKQKNEELLAQEEELRQNLEEMQTTQEELQRQNEENKKIQENLEKETYLLRALMANIPDHIYFKDMESRFLRVSNSMVKVFNMKSEDEILGKSDFDFFDDEHARPAYKDEQKIIKTGNPIVDIIEKEVHKDGSITYVSTSKLPLVDLNGKIIGTFGISRDVTAQQQMEMDVRQKNEELLAQEEELRQNLEEMQTTQEELQRQIEENKKIQVDLEKETYLLNALLTNVPDHIYFKDNKSKFIRVSNSMLKIFNLSSENELLGKSDFDFFDEKHARPAFQDEQKIIKTGKPLIDIVEKEVHKDGTIAYVSTSKMPLIDLKGKIIGTFGISKDITEQKQMEMDIKQKNEELLATEEELRQNLEEMLTTQEELQRQNEETKKIQQELEKETYLLDALMTNVPDRIYFKDIKSKFIRASKSLVDLFNLKSENDLIGKSDFDFFDKQHAKPAYDDEQKIIKTGKPMIDLVEKEVHKDGSVTWSSTSKMPLKDSKKKIVGTFGISKNITDKVRIENELKNKMKESSQRESELQNKVMELTGLLKKRN